MFFFFLYLSPCARALLCVCVCARVCISPSTHYSFWIQSIDLDFKPKLIFNPKHKT